MKEIVGRVVTDPGRREEIYELLSGLEQLVPDDDDLLMVIRSITLEVLKQLKADPKAKELFAGMETTKSLGYRKGHSYITVVVNHETNTVIWAVKDHGKSVLQKFCEQLTPEQRA